MALLRNLSNIIESRASNIDRALDILSNIDTSVPSSCHLDTSLHIELFKDIMKVVQRCMML